MNPKKLNDYAIRESLFTEIYSLVPSFEKIVEELELEKGQSRIDLAIIGKELIGIEIKSDRDSLARLSSQVITYNKSLEKIILIVGEKYRETACDYIPSWWGFAFASYDENWNVTIKVIRKPKKNPEFNISSLLNLLWKDEAIDILREKGITKGLSSLAKWSLQEKILSTHSHNEIKNSVINALITRQSWKAAQ